MSDIFFPHIKTHRSQSGKRHFIYRCSMSVAINAPTRTAASGAISPCMRALPSTAAKNAATAASARAAAFYFAVAAGIFIHSGRGVCVWNHSIYPGNIYISFVDHTLTVYILHRSAYACIVCLRNSRVGERNPGNFGIVGYIPAGGFIPHEHPRIISLGSRQRIESLVINPYPLHIVPVAVNIIGLITYAVLHHLASVGPIMRHSRCTVDKELRNYFMPQQVVCRHSKTHLQHRPFGSADIVLKS